MIKRTVWLILLLLWPALAFAVGPLRVAVSPDYPPLVFKQDGKLHGVEVDNARAVSEILSRRLVLVEKPFAELIPALQSGDVDVIMSGMSVTAKRSQQVLFTDSYLRVGQMTIMHRDKVARFAQPWSIYREGVRVGVEPGTTGDQFAQRELPAATISYFDNPEAAFEALREDLIDLYVHDAPTSWRLANDGKYADLISLYKPLTEEMLAWAVRKEDTELAAALNEALRLMRANGTLDYILNRWIPVTIEVR